MSETHTHDPNDTEKAKIARKLAEHVKYIIHERSDPNEIAVARLDAIDRLIGVSLQKNLQGDWCCELPAEHPCFKRCEVRINDRTINLYDLVTAIIKTLLDKTNSNI